MSCLKTMLTISCQRQRLAVEQSMEEYKEHAGALPAARVNTDCLSRAEFGDLNYQFT